MNKPLYLILVLGLGLAGCAKSEDEPAEASERGRNPLHAPTDYLGAVGQAKRTAERTVDLAGLNQAIQMFRAQEGRFPRDLNELVAKEYLRQMPAPPPGTRYVYNPATGQVQAVRQ